MRSTLPALALTTALVPLPLAADVAPEDVWAMSRLAMETFGFDVAANATRTGDTLTVDGTNLSAVLPMGIGLVEMDLPAVDYVDQGDGTVAVVWPNDFTMNFRVEIAGEDPFAAGLEVTQTGIATSVASGDPDDMVFVSASDGYAMRVALPDTVPVEFDLDLSGDGYQSETRMVRGASSLSITNASTQAPVTAEFEVQSGMDFAQKSASRYGEMVSDITMVLPFDMDLMNLTPALRAGLSVAGTSSYTSSETETLTVMGDADGSYQKQTTGRNAATFALGADGLDLSVTAEVVAFEMNDPNLAPLSITVAADNVTAGYVIPLVSGEAAQDFGLHLGLEGLTMAEELWALFDPAADLPRDPIALSIDVGGTARLGVDVLDFNGWMARGPEAVPDIQVRDVRIDALNLAALGASAATTGGFVLDYADTETFPGFPRPEGSAEATITGAQALLDLLEGTGLIGESELASARFGLGMFTRSTGDDTATTTVEITPEGHVLVNGTRMY